MAVKIRLTRTGATNDACYRVVAADMRSPRDGRNLEILGWYDPGQTGVNFKLKLDRVDHWIGEGAQVSDTAASLIRKARKLGDEVPAEAPEAPAEVAEVEAPVEEPEAPAEEVVAEEPEEAVEKEPATADAG